jgi:site-specific DNA-methyltransferase (adenine-specific)
MADFTPSLDVHFGDNLEILSKMSDASFDLIYIDPPFNTGKVQSRTRLQTFHDENGDRVGFQGRRYRTVKVGTKAYADTFDDYLGFLEPRMEEAQRLLKPNGSFFFHIDYREVHYCKVLLDSIFGRKSFINEIIWAYDYGARATKRWSPKHDTILWYAKDPESYTFRFEDIYRIPYMAPDLVGPEKAARGKTPTDTWWNTIVSPTGKEKTGYPTQKPITILNRIVQVHSNRSPELTQTKTGFVQRQVPAQPEVSQLSARASRTTGLVDLEVNYRETPGCAQCTDAENVVKETFATTNTLTVASIDADRPEKTSKLSTTTNPGDKLLDFFAGSGTLGEAALVNGRDCVLIDSNLEAVAVMKARFKHFNNVTFHGLEAERG